MSLVTAEQAIAHVKADATEDVSLYLAAAEQRTVDFLGRNVYPDQQSLDDAVAAGTAGDRPMVVNASIKAAILLTFGSLYRNREDVITGTSAAAVKIPMSAEDFLWPWRVGLGV